MTVDDKFLAERLFGWKIEHGKRWVGSAWLNRITGEIEEGDIPVAVPSFSSDYGAAIEAIWRLHERAARDGDTGGGPYSRVWAQAEPELEQVKWHSQPKERSAAQFAEILVRRLRQEFPE